MAFSSSSSSSFFFPFYRGGRSGRRTVPLPHNVNDAPPKKKNKKKKKTEKTEKNGSESWIRHYVLVKSKKGESFFQIHRCAWSQNSSFDSGVVNNTSVARGGGGGNCPPPPPIMLFRSFVDTFGNLSVHVSRQAYHLYRQNIWSTD